MSEAVRQVLDLFDALAEREQQEAVVEILRRVDRLTPEELPDETFVELAEELFLDLDASEASDIKP